MQKSQERIAEGLNEENFQATGTGVVRKDVPEEELRCSEVSEAFMIEHDLTVGITYTWPGNLTTPAIHVPTDPCEHAQLIGKPPKGCSEERWELLTWLVRDVLDKTEVDGFELSDHMEGMRLLSRWDLLDPGLDVDQWFEELDRFRNEIGEDVE